MKTTPIKAESHAFIISLCLHLILFILIALFWLKETYQKSEETVSIELVEVDKIQQKFCLTSGEKIWNYGQVEAY